MSILTLSGSPSVQSRSGLVLAHLRTALEAAGERTRHLELRDLPAGPLLAARVDDDAIAAATRAVADAQVVVLATPVYKAAYSGLLKAFLDLLPQTGLRDKIVLPIATGGSLAHALAIDYALRPVLSALGSRQILPGIFAVDQQIDTSASSASSDGGGVRHARFDAALSARLDEGLLRVRDALAHARIEVPLDALDVVPGAFVQRAAAAAVVAQRCTA
ncbi:NADPH-dependent FMN reductase [Cupriavidus oxalaticus]|uniref:FMN reductase (NADPH) n=1 Tax=Cupriavidus oxalaticus TaxID=96344 RepID=A0A375G281_9BURK|nr:NADPH-dependent FMN reductase [Cupriavidus oxalaticus]QEZ48506.1 FMN reductase (NADPH) [Cupriavidus oxalaticus]QRQ88730.1 NADPH-dependent FMN reductase [Cupriavidus oxalaticus]QRQ92944.1 NADPH-dependent FMN reductase [Cupriavidus oxalaticus]WQD81553.1 NADPH-dependent FMN reductase [Cupriavidus oxalaticus]SPC05635.1 NAD(P)H-dependent FMN reductase, sulfate starvation-induced protein [Cupriavidus oxalaticus]